jgi:hypothetical protein
MPTGYGKSVTKKASVATAPKPATTTASVKTPSVLDEFDEFARECRKVVLARMQKLKAQDADYHTCKIISNKILIDCFRGCKWNP